MKKLKYTILILTGCYFLITVFTPIVLKNTIAEKISSVIAKKATIKSLYLNPFTNSISVNEFKIEDDLKIQQIYLNLSFFKILKKNLIVEELVLDGIKLKISYEKGVVVIHGLEKFSNDINSSSNVKETSNKSTDSAPPILISLDNLLLSNTNIQINENNQIQIDQLMAKNIPLFKQSQQSAIDLNLRINESRLSIKAQGNILKQDFNTSLQLQKLNLSPLFNLVDTKNKLEGILSLESRLALKDQSIQINHTNIELESFSFGKLNQNKIDYLISNLKLNNLDFLQNKEDLKLKIDSINLKNFEFSRPIKSLVPVTKLQNKLNLNNIQVHKDKNNKIEVNILNNDNGPIEIVKDGHNFYLLVKNFDLLPLSRSIYNELNYFVDSGKLNLKVNYQETRPNRIQGKAKVQLAQLKLNDENVKGKKESKNESFLPLPSALSMIKTDNGDIQIIIDIDGKADDPNFGIISMAKNGLGSVVFNKFAEIVAIKAATQFLPMLLSSIPFSPANAFMLVKGGYKLLTKPRFENIQFKPQTDAITSDSKKQIKNLTDFLQKNKNFNFQLCPVASIFENGENDQDPTLDEEEALNLAKKRIERVKEKFKDYNSTLDQVVFCRPVISKNITKNGEMVVEL